MRHVLAFCLMVVATATHAQGTLPAANARVLQQGLIETADAFVLPAYQAQAEAAAVLVHTLENYCAENGDLAAAQVAFADTFLAWQRASIIAVGPIMDAEGPMRVQLWPDPKGFSQRAVRLALRAEDAALLKQGGLKGRSIAMTNLMALELLLYDALPVGSYSCDFAIAIARFQADLAHDLARAWTAGSTFRADYDTAQDGNARFRSVDALIREVLAGAVVYADRLRKLKLQRGIGKKPGDARAERTEARLSGAGLQSITVSFLALADLYDVPFGIFDAAADIGGAMAYLTLAQTANSVADGLTWQAQTLADIAREDGAAAAELRRYADLVLYHETFLKSGFPASVGLVAGFTAADGD